MNLVLSRNAFLLVAVVALAACATDPGGSFKSATGATFSARSSPAKILPAGTKLEDASLLRLGELSADVLLKECYERCRTIQESGNATEMLASEAAAKGADLVVLLEENARVIDHIQKEECARSEMGSVKENYIYYEDGFRKSGTRSIPVPQCAAYKTVYGKRHVVRSTGVIYRRGETKALEEQNRRALVRQFVAANDYSGFAAALKADPALADVRIARQGYKFAMSAVDFAVISAAPGALKALLAAGADPNGWRNSDSMEPPLQRALHVHNYHRSSDPARSRAGLECLRLLLEHGADPNLPDRGLTPLHAAVRDGDVEAVRLLLAHGADETIPAKPTSRRATADRLRNRTAHEIVVADLRSAEFAIEHKLQTAKYHRERVPRLREIVQLLQR